eukprot:TRINITY_DN2104_c0_g1_i1.p1 TRINITY_DN2104_c0_g1~~TRINITY_DN2104_c0_g1_i1.p1  ORF type:complete len:664 (+),score=186.51 TRINITY_DN2104_c0_g1_i1:1377-3368(+)
MSGRDIIGCAKTGSGKTLAFVLPMLRHVLDQQPLVAGEGPIALLMAPTRELAQQIYAVTRRFCKYLNLRAVCVYGGSGIADQIGDLKRGAEIVVCTPGRMIDILCSNSGRITNMRRVTYIVLDEADRMFDLGFEPQIARIIDNVRPDRQTVMFSATFPLVVEQAARRILRRPLEIVCGGRSVACKDVTQYVEFLADDEAKFRRLLELVHEWYERGQILIFVERQSSADKLYQELMGANYPCLVLHGGIDQKDRASTIADFKRGERNVLVATSVCARGIDVKGLELVINFDPPNHMEDYVHRVGRTGRAGRKGTAYTFLTDDQERFAPDLEKALAGGEQHVPEKLKTMAEAWRAKKKEAKEAGGTMAGQHGGYGGHGFRFDDSEEKKLESDRRMIKLLHGVADDSSSDEEGEKGDKRPKTIAELAAAIVNNQIAPPAPGSMAAAVAAAAAAGVGGEGPTEPVGPGALVLSRPVILGSSANARPVPLTSSISLNVPRRDESKSPLATLPALPAVVPPGVAAAVAAGQITLEQQAAAQKAAQFAAQLNMLQTLQKVQSWGVAQTHFEEELEINDYPQQARWRVTHKDALAPITDWTGAAITTRGSFVAPGKQPPPGERKLFLFIEGPTADSVGKAKKEIKRVLEESSLLLHPDQRTGGGRYNPITG